MQARDRAIRERKQIMRHTKLLLPIAVLAAASAHASAVVLLSNLDEPVRNHSDISSAGWAAQGFWTDANAYRLDSIRIIGGNQTGPTSPFAELRNADANGNMFIAPISTFEVPSMGDPISEREFTPHSIVILAPMTKYFFLLGNSTTGVESFEWAYAEGNGSVGPGTFDHYEYTFNGGLTWIPTGFENPFFLQVNVSPVPEPASVLALLAGGFGVLARRRRKENERK